MHHNYLKVTLNLFVVLSASILFGCKKGSNPNPQSGSFTITSLSVTQGPYNTTVVINGTGFSSTLADDNVSFNGKTAVVTVATPTQLTTAVPLGAGTGNVSLVINNQTGKGPVFTYQLSAVVSTIAGSGQSGSANGTGNAASFNVAYAITADANGNLFVSDKNNNLIREITPAGVVTTVAGSGAMGSADGTGILASFFEPAGLTVDKTGNIYVADFDKSLIRKITPAGIVTTIAGDGTIGLQDGVGTAASFYLPMGIALDANNNLFVAEYGDLSVREISPNFTVTTFTGNPFTPSYDNLTCIAIDKANNIYVSDLANIVRKITPAGSISILAGSGVVGSANGVGTSASFNNITGLATDGSGNIYVADAGNHLIRKITPDGTVSTFAGSGIQGSQDGPGNTASFNGPLGIAIDPSGNMYIADAYSIRKITLQ